MRKNWVDFSLIKKAVAFRDVLEHYNLLAQFKERGEELTGKCPFHPDSKPSLHISLRKNVFHCFGCERKRLGKELKVELLDFIIIGNGFYSFADNGRLFI